MKTKAELTADVAIATANLERAQQALGNFDSAPENNVFESLDDAADLEDKLYARAAKDCEGSYNCGQTVYDQEFIVDGKHYIATLTCEYNRHDKQYYYVEESEFSIEEKS